MAEQMLLTDEIHRIVTSPYAVCLKNFSDLLNRTNRCHFERWASGNACHVDALVATVLEGLQSWPHALSILQHLSGVVSCRDAALRRKPLLLQTLLTKGVESDKGFEKYAITCVSLLSAKLPEDVPIPSALPPFFTKVLEKANETPSIATLRPIHLIMLGVGSTLLEMLSLDVLVRLQEHLIDILNSLEAHPAKLISLAIFANMASTRSSDRSSTVDVTSTSGGIHSDPVDVFHSACKFFTSRRAPKTIGLIVMQVIQACSQNSTLGLTDAIESLKLSKQIIDVFDIEEKNSWVINNQPKIRKLYEKILRQDNPIDLQFFALEFVGSLADIESLPEEIVVAFESLLHTPMPLTVSECMIEKFAVRFDETSLRAHILDILQKVSEERLPTSDSLAELNFAINKVLGFTRAIPSSARLRRMILCALPTNEFSSLLNQFLKAPLLATKLDAGHGQVGICCQIYAEAHLQLQRRLCTLFTKTVLYASHDKVGIDLSMANALLEKQVSLSSTYPTWSTCKPRRPNSETIQLSLFESGSTPTDSSASHDWRANLLRDIFRASSHQYESVVRQMGEVCRDLELRCNDAENPLREERIRSSDLLERLETSDARAAELRTEVEERSLVLDGLEAENTRLVGQIFTTEQSVQNLSNDVEELRERLAATSEEARLAAETANETEKLQKLEYLAITLAKDETNEAQTLKVKTLENQIEDLGKELMQARSQNLDNMERISYLEESIEERDTAMEEAGLLAKTRETDIDRLLQKEVHLEADLNSLKLEVIEVHDRNKSLLSDLDGQNLAFVEERSAMQHERDAYAASKATEILEEKNHHENLVQDLRAQLEQASNDAALLVAQREWDIAELERKVTKLLHQREERAKEFATAQELSSRLIAVMGINSVRPDLSRPMGENPNSARSITDCAVTEESDEKVYGSDFTHSFGSSTSSKSGPTPKRTKVYRHRKDSTVKHGKVKEINVIIKPPGGISHASRCPLIALGPNTHNAANSSPTRPFLKESFGKLNSRESLIAQENKSTRSEFISSDDSFGDSDVFASTDRQQRNRTLVMGPESIHEETTDEL